MVHAQVIVAVLAATLAAAARASSAGADVPGATAGARPGPAASGSAPGPRPPAEQLGPGAGERSGIARARGCDDDRDGAAAERRRARRSQVKQKELADWRQAEEMRERVP